MSFGKMNQRIDLQQKRSVVDEEGFRNTLSNRSTINVQSYTAVTYVYRCPNCNKEISYDDQVKVAKKQAQAGRKILLEKE
jgi:DNA-directed RNA polymerase subunit RPC12/RpoP